jgi:hypothetical protein
MGILAVGGLGRVRHMLSLLLLAAAVIVTIVAAIQWAGRLRAFGLATMEMAGRHWHARAGNAALAVILWLAWLYV